MWLIVTNLWRCSCKLKISGMATSGKLMQCSTESNSRKRRTVLCTKLGIKPVPRWENVENWKWEECLHWTLSNLPDRMDVPDRVCAKVGWHTPLLLRLTESELSDKPGLEHDTAHGRVYRLTQRCYNVFDFGRKYRILVGRNGRTWLIKTTLPPITSYSALHKCHLNKRTLRGRSNSPWMSY